VTGVSSGVRRLGRAAAVAACTGLAAACTSAAGPGTDEKTIRLSFSGSRNFGDLPSFVAHARLRAEGYTILETFYSGADLAIDALARGDADIGVGSITGAWAAAARGADVRSVMEHVANPHRLVAVPAIAECAGLDGRRLALNGEAAVSTDLLRVYLAQACPDARPAVLHIQSVENRAAALLAGTIDAATIELGVLGWLEEQAPGRFRVVENFAARWPSIKTTGVQVNARFAAARPEVVLAYIRARLAANRDMSANPDLVVAEATRVLGPSARWPRVARAYLDAGAWAADGGLTITDVERTLAFFENDTLRRARPHDVSDLSFLEAALASK
jgi:ABC-type nitrate/sulfonate/bicarbonate transport system substrate-binding protein